LASSGIGTALPLAAAGFAVANYLNNGPLNDNQSKVRNTDAYLAANPDVKPIAYNYGKVAGNYYLLPDGKLISGEQFNDLAGNWYGATYAPDGNQADWAQKYQTTLQSLSPVTPAKGYHLDAASGKIVRD
jgi:hypothetical protein